MTQRRLFPTFLSMALVAGALQADSLEPQAPQEDSALKELAELMNVQVISVSKVAQRPIDAPGVVSAISREQLKDYGWLSLNDVLGSQPGFSPSQDYDRRTLSARGVFEGWNNNHLLVLVDGIPMNDSVYGSAYTSEVTPLFLARSLEVMRGPGSALYGSNAMNGVAAINTVKADDLKGIGEARIRFGDRGTRSLDFLTGGSGDLFSYVASYSTFATHGHEYASPDGSGRTDAQDALLTFPTRDRRNNDYFFAKVEGLYGLDGFSLQFHQQRWSFETGLGWLFVAPDTGESMNEQRQILVLRYAKETGKLTQEYALRYQTHLIDWNTRYYPSDFVYSPGLSENLNTSSDELFARAQFTWKWGKDGSVVGGFEGSRFAYNGDHAHFSNVNINFDGDFNPVEDGRPIPLGGFLQWTEGHPVLRTALYLQGATGRILNGRVAITAGLRYDKQDSDFNELDRPRGSSGAFTTGKLAYSKVSPRLGLVFHQGETYTLKFLVGRAFRTPSPSETFGANTYALASNIRQIQPETSDSLELASDWILNKHVDWRINFYQSKMKNLIGYSLTNANLSTNLYNLTTRGFETEVLWSFGAWSGYGNLSFAKRVDEDIVDPTIHAETDITWVPSRTANVGVAWKTEKLGVSLALHYQGEVRRRTSDLSLPPSPFAARSATVAPWTSANLRFSYHPHKSVEFELGLSNALDSKGYLAKNFQNPFDYRTDPRSLWVGLRLK
jgi:iron complex outermembrane receptor protein